MTREILGWLLGWIVRPWLASLRLRRVGRWRVERLRAERAQVLFALLHADQLLVLRGHASDRPTVLVSHSRDGALLAGALRSFGYSVVRGSTSRGAVAGWLGLRRHLRVGRTPTFAVDGPRGPAGSVAPGVVALARTAGAVIVPVAACAQREARASSWDRTRLPFPGSRVVVVYGRPMQVDSDSSLEAGCEALRVRLTLTAARAERLVRAS